MDDQKVKLFMPIEFYSEQIIPVLDKKIELLCTRYKFGKINISIGINKGVIFEIVYTDEVRLRQSANTPSMGDVIAVAKPDAQNTVDNS